MTSRPEAASRRSRTIAGYLLMIGATVGGYLLVRAYGEHLMAPALPGGGAFGRGSGQGPIDALMHVLLALGVVIVAARVLGMLFARLHQPPVIGEIIAGILLGPSLLGRFAPDVS